MEGPVDVLEQLRIVGAVGILVGGLEDTECLVAGRGEGEVRTG